MLLPDELRIDEITSTRDPRWPQWKSIYESSFAPFERLPDETYDVVLNGRARGEITNVWLFAAESVEEPGVVTGIADVVWHPQARAVLLRYFATKESLRGRGIGQSFYAAILAQCKHLCADLMVFEVEKPEIMAERSEAESELARRRIRWYLRQGAKQLGGIHYDLVIAPGKALMEMHLMAHTFIEMTAREVFDAAKMIFGDALEQTEELTFE
ncbi:MAG TPA: hypothetical protein VGM51_13945 [Armatimonadota bacterium]|jgi:GNAT superfamily N-acetyltransferase